MHFIRYVVLHCNDARQQECRTKVSTLLDLDECPMLLCLASPMLSNSSPCLLWTHAAVHVHVAESEVDMIISVRTYLDG